MCVVVVVAVVAAAPATAQSSTQDRRWEIEGYGGATFPTGSLEGGATLPEAGPAIATSSPIFPSRRVPSWFFGDGASLLNAVNQQFGMPAAIEPLDAALGALGLTSGNGIAAGVRVRRGLWARNVLEVSLDLFPGSSNVSDELLAAAAASSASFVPAFQGLLGTGPFTDVAVEASSSAGGSALELALTGALVRSFGAAGGFDPYITLGGGITSGAGSATLMLEGRYRFQIIGEVPIDETDRTTVKIENRTAFTGVAGAGLRREINDRWGVRIDGRVFVGPETTRIVIDTDPAVATGTPADFVESFTTPSIQFSNNPSTGRESSLGGPPLEGFETFAPDGWRVRVLITAGVFFRF